MLKSNKYIYFVNYFGLRILQKHNSTDSEFKRNLLRKLKTTWI